MGSIDLHVFDHGSGPPVVLLHGLPSPPADLEALASALPGMRVLVPHLPGYGPTPAAPGAQGVAATERALIAALRARDVERPVVVGYSMGGYRALSLALAIEVSAVVALAGFSDLSAEERAGMRGFADALRAGTDLREVLPPRFVSARHLAAQPDDARVVGDWIDLASPAVFIEELDDLADAPSLTSRLSELSCPVLARTGELDVATPPSHARTIAEATRNGTFEIVPGAGHALFLEDPTGTRDAVRRACGL